MAATTPPTKTTNTQVEGRGSKDPNTPAAEKPNEHPDVKTSAQASTNDVKPIIHGDTNPDVGGPQHIPGETRLPPHQVPEGQAFQHDVAARKSERPSTASPLGPTAHNLSIRRAGRGVGPEAGRETRMVRVLRESYVNHMLCPEGTITYWPDGVEKLGPNLEEYTG